MSLPKPAAFAAHAHSFEEDNETSLQTELTSSLQFDGAGFVPTKPTLEDHQEQGHLYQTDSLTFPTLESDGSLPDLREASASTRCFTPPAAVSSVGAKAGMAGNMNTEASTDSLLDEQYDMVDDASEMTNDDRETASLASTEDAMSDEEGRMTHDNDEDNVVKFNAGSVGDLAGTLFNGDKQQSLEEDNRIMDSYMTDDLETPRQSTIYPFAETITPTPPTSNPTTSTAKADPLCVRVLLYCSKSLDSPVVASKITARIATSVGNGKGECQTFELPPTPDNTEGSVICRHGNVIITVDRIDQSSSELEVNALVQRNRPDLLVFYLTEITGYPSALVKGIYETNEHNFKTLVIARSTDGISRTDDLYGCDLGMEGQDFFGDAAKTRPRLRQLMGGMPASEDQYGRRTDNKAKKTKIQEQELPAWMRIDASLMRIALGALILALVAPAFFAPDFFISPAVVSLDHQKQILSSSLSDWLGSPDYFNSDNVHELFPQELGTALKATRAKFTIILPNYVVLSVIAKDGHAGSGITHVNVSRLHDRDIDYNLTTLADGYFGFALPVDEMHGMITVNVTMKKPARNFDLTHDFGSPLWHRTTYQKASTDLTKAINKDVAVARKAAKSLTDRVTLEVSAGVAATQNVTTQLATRMTREVAVLANHAVDVFGKMASNGAGTAQQLSEDIAVARKDLIKCVDDVKRSLALTAHSIKDLIVPSKQSFTSPLKRSHQRAMGFKEAMSGKRTKGDTSRGHNWFGSGADRDNPFRSLDKRGGAETNSKRGKCKGTEKFKGCS